MSLEDIVRNAREGAIRGAIDKLSKTQEWQQKSTMSRLYMLCIELETTHVTLSSALRRMKIKL